MKTEFKYYDENNNLINANLILSFTYNDKNYIVYDSEEDDNDTLGVLHVREYEEIDNVPHLYKVSKEELNQIKEIILSVYKSAEE